MLAGNTTREVESDTVGEQELKTVKRYFGGLNEGIWPKSSLGHETKFDVLCSLDRSGGSSTGLMQKYDSWFRSAEATEPAGAQRWTSWSAKEKMDQLEQ
ncbi:BTB/POZ domain-containing protein [Dorcoceras hygrometricum]|uniref:BTB/POZ domain-containing protein n=1 Tax=Dorcoceras hygrometricum TaxID=472368 RepID=A0A2Z7CEA5_9LAMI|nr:BTB/POZ domain-containing protein [Dorcoceras hygrometricum]